MRLRSGGAYASELPPQNALPHDVLVRIFSYLPRGALVVTPGRVSHAWAAAKAEAWAAVRKRDIEKGYDSDEEDATEYPFLPLWYVQSIYDTATEEQKSTILNGACCHGAIDVVEELFELDRAAFFADAGACTMAAWGGQFELLQFLFEQGCPMGTRTCNGAARAGNLPMLRWLKENGCEWDVWTCHTAARKGNLPILRYAHTHGCPMNEKTSFDAAQEGHLDVVQFLHQNGCPWDHRTCALAAEMGHWEIVKYAHERGCPLGASTLYSAARDGNLHILRLAHERGVPIDVEECIDQARDHPECRAWLETLLPPPGAQ